MFENELFWITVSFVIFITFALRPVSNILSSLLDKRALDIQSQLDEATRLKEEAQQLLADYQIKQKEMEKQSAQILEAAEIESKRITKDAELNLEKTISNKVELAIKKISTYEESILEDIRSNAVDITVHTLRQIVEDNLGEEIAEDLIDEAIKNISKSIH